MKKWLAFLLAFVIAGCANSTGYKQVDISLADLEEKIENKESFYLLTERDDCPFCESLNAYVMDNGKDHDITVYRLDTTDMDFKKLQETDKTLVSETEEGSRFLELQPYFLYTPAIYRYEDGKAETAAIGWNNVTEEISVWDTGSTIDFDTARTESLWDFLEGK